MQANVFGEFFFWHRDGTFSPKFRRTREETAGQNASGGILLSPFLTCAAGLSFASKRAKKSQLLKSRAFAANEFCKLP